MRSFSVLGKFIRWRVAHALRRAGFGLLLPAAALAGADWSDFGNGHENQRFSGLEQIHRDNVGTLVPRWMFQAGAIGPIQAQPVVADGAMVLTLPGNDVVKLDAESGELLWRYRHTPRFSHPRLGGTNRGATIAGGKVYHATNDGRLVALDFENGAVLWDRIVTVPAEGEREQLPAERAATLDQNLQSLAIKMAPLVLGDVVIVGTTLAGYGLYYNLGAGVRESPPPSLDDLIGKRGYVAAFDAATGSERWRWYTTKTVDWEGEFSTTTPDGFALPRDVKAEREHAPTLKDASHRGGSSTWMTPAYDEELGLIFLGTGNASPNDVPRLRPGDNLYANSLVALEAETGRVKWHYQQVPADLWGYDVASAPVLFEAERDGVSIPAVGVAGKTGWFYAHDRRSGALLFKSDPLVPQNGIFAKPTERGTTISPGSFGGASWSPVSYDPRQGWIYVAAIHKPTRLYLRTWEGDGPNRQFIEADPDTDEPSWGTLSAVDTRAAGRIRWQERTEEPLIGGVLATAGNLVFTGETNGFFGAFDSKTGDRLWRFFCGAGVNSPPVSYEIDGTQFVAVAASGHPYFGTRRGDAVIAFALPGS